MQKHTDPTSEGALLRYSIFDRNSSYLKDGPPDQRDTSELEEFGISARVALTNDILIKRLADETVSQGTGSTPDVRTIVHLCYNWKLQLPFVVVEREVNHARSEYTPQYGRDDNYVKRTWSNTKYKLFSLSECEKHEPEAAQLLNQLE